MSEISELATVIADQIDTVQAGWRSGGGLPFKNETDPPTSIIVDAILYGLERAGLVIVPREPTKEMVDAGDTALNNCKDSGCDSGDGEGYHFYEYIISGAQTTIEKAMIDASITPASPASQTPRAP